jgi:hypothetical protein
MSRLPVIPHALQRPPRGARRRLALVAVIGNVLVGLACGEDVLVARFGLTSSGLDGGVLDVAAEDAGTGKDKLNQQSTNAQKARAKARRIERANDHPPSDDSH